MMDYGTYELKGLSSMSKFAKILLATITTRSRIVDSSADFPKRTRKQHMPDTTPFKLLIEIPDGRALEFAAIAENVLKRV